jgi:hypothetical protein
MKKSPTGTQGEVRQGANRLPIPQVREARRARHIHFHFHVSRPRENLF